MEQLVNFIIRPPRADYSPKNDLLDQEFMLKGRWFQRKDLEVTNARGNVLQCSHYMPLSIPEGKTLPCVIYCHGNSGCRADASEAAIILLPSNITVFTLDFSGSGRSEGEYVTLGWNEKEDLQAVVNHLRIDGNVSCIGLWGRSMGAVTSLMYGAEDPSIAGMVLDSPFSNLVDLMMELVDTYKYPLPKFTVKLAIQHMRRVIRRKANFDIMDLDAIKVAKCCFVPALLGHATDDDFIHPHHSDHIYNAYAGDKNIIKFDGDHNSPRPQFYFDSITIFFHNVLNPPMDMSSEPYYQTMDNYLDRDNWEAINGVEYTNPNFVQPPSGLGTSSTEDAINRLRTRRPMSRTDVPADIPSPGKLWEVEENQSESDLGSSSSRCVRSDLTNGHSHDPIMPSAANDQYLEYEFDELSDMPCSMEDEERMLLEAVMESLKDMEMRPPQEAHEPNTEATISPCSPDGVEDSTTMSSGSSATIRSSTSAPDAGELAGEIASLPPVSGTDSESTTSSATGDMASSKQSSCNTGSSTQDTDMAAGTRATLVVQKNPAGHILDGLVHRWGNFFKNCG